jgi:hypothetical protein
VIVESTTLLTTLYGPAPTGLAPKFAPSLASAVGDTMYEPEEVDNVARRIPSGELKFKTTSKLFGVVIDVTFFNAVWQKQGLPGSLSRFRFAATAAALNGVPSWKVTPARSFKVPVRPPSLIVRLFARSGRKVSFGPISKRFP